MRGELFDIDEADIRVRGTELYVDARAAKAMGYVSHGHWDHIARHATVYSSEITRRVLEDRVGSVQWVALGDDDTRVGDVEISTRAAGHCAGSTMLRVRRGGGTGLHTGDLGRAGLICGDDPSPEPVDELVIDATYGHPRHDYPSLSAARRQLLDAVEYAFSRGKVPVVFAYSYGRSQEVAATLLEAGHRVAASRAVYRHAALIRDKVESLEGLTRLSGRPRSGDVVLYADRARSGRTRPFADAFRIACSGRTGDAAAAQMKVDEIVPLVDHATYPELLEFIAACKPSKVYTQHVHAVAFARELRERGYDAEPAEQPLQQDLFGPF